MSHLHEILLRPNDVLFFRDGRPMSGSLAGHTASWPMPDMTNHALHAALHRADFDNVHTHRRGRSGQYSQDDAHRDRKFGSLLTAGPFPVDSSGHWYLPRPKDAQKGNSVDVTHFPVQRIGSSDNDLWLDSSLPDPLEFAVASKLPPSKETPAEPWISSDAFSAYLRDETFSEETAFLRDDQLADREQQIGIAIDPETGTTGQGAAAGMIYSAHYLRLRDQYRLGLFAEAQDKNTEGAPKSDLIEQLLNGEPRAIIVGGQQRVCSATRVPVGGQLPLPIGRSAEFVELEKGRRALKWVLLTPAIWPQIIAGTSQRGTERRAHPGGWLPNWIDPEEGRVLLQTVPAAERRRRRSLNAGGQGYPSEENAKSIDAKLVAAIIPKPIPVTGWALPSAEGPGGAKSTHLAVPAGAVFYFEAASAGCAEALANALNWHGESKGTDIKNRRSTLLGEKGYGLGVCGTWHFHHA